MYVYTTEEYPIFVDSTKKGDFIPTVFTIKAFPDIIPKLKLTKEAEQRVYSEQKLEWPLISNWEDLNEFKNDDVYAVTSSEDQVLAVVAMACSIK
jgi:hypothetical protein